MGIVSCSWRKGSGPDQIAEWAGMLPQLARTRKHMHAGAMQRFPKRFKLSVSGRTQSVTASRLVGRGQCNRRGHSGMNRTIRHRRHARSLSECPDEARLAGEAKVVDNAFERLLGFT